MVMQKDQIKAFRSKVDCTDSLDVVVRNAEAFRDEYARDVVLLEKQLFVARKRLRAATEIYVRALEVRSAFLNKII